MKTLGLYRHAKSDWNDARARDFDRPLNARGRKGAALIGRYIAAHGIDWQRVIASPAVRVAQTIEIGSEAAGITIPVIWDRRIYLASSAILLDLVREVRGDPLSILMVGHNPGLEDLISILYPMTDQAPCATSSRKSFRRRPMRCWSLISMTGPRQAKAVPGWST